MISLSEHTLAAFKANYAKMLKKVAELGQKSQNDLARLESGKMGDSKFQIEIAHYEEQLDILSRESIDVRCQYWEYKWEEDRERNHSNQGNESVE